MDDLAGAYEAALDAEGSALRENEAHLDSIEGRISLFNSAVQTMWMNFLNDDVVKFVVDLGTQIIQLVDKIGLLESAIGVFTGFHFAKTSIKDAFESIGKGTFKFTDMFKWPTSDKQKGTDPTTEAFNAVSNAAYTTADAFKAVADAAHVAAEADQTKEASAMAAAEADTTEAASSAASSHADAAEAKSSIGSAAADETESKSSLRAAAADTAEAKSSMRAATADAGEANASTAGAAAEVAGDVGEAAASAVGAGVAAKATGSALAAGATKVGAFALGGLKGILISLAISAVLSLLGKFISWIADKHESEEEKIEQATDAINTYSEKQEELKDQKKTVDELSESYTRLSTGVNTVTNDNIGLTTEAYQEYLEVCNDIAEMYPELVVGYDEQGNAIVNLTNKVGGLKQAYIDAQKEAAKLLLDDKIIKTIWKSYQGSDSLKEAENGEFTYTLEDQRKVLEGMIALGPGLIELYNAYNAGGTETDDALYKLFGEDQMYYYRRTIQGMGLDMTQSYEQFAADLHNRLTSVTKTISADMADMRTTLEAQMYFDVNYQALNDEGKNIVDVIIRSMSPSLIEKSGAETMDEWFEWFSENVVRAVANSQELYDTLTDASNRMARAIANNDQDAFRAAQREFNELVSGWINLDTGDIEVDPDADVVTQFFQQIAKDAQESAKNYEIRLQIRTDIELQPKRSIQEIVNEQTGLSDIPPELELQGAAAALRDLDAFIDDKTLGDMFDTISIHLNTDKDGKLRTDEIQDAYDDYLSWLSGDNKALEGWTEPQIEAMAVLHALCQMYSTDIATITDEMVRGGYAFESLDNVVSFDLASESTNEFVDEFQSDVDAIKDAWESLNHGEMTRSDFLDLAQEFPELMKGVDFSKDNWMVQAKANLDALNATTVDDFIAELNEMKDAMIARGEDTTIVDSMIAYAEQFRDMSEVVAEVQADTITGLTDAHEQYKSIMEETSEVLYNGQKVSDGYYESLVKYIDDTEALNACFDENNKQIVTNADALKELINKQHEADVQNVRLAKSQAQLKYYELVRQLGDTTRSMSYLSDAGDVAVDSLLDQIGVVKDAIAQYQLLEDNLLGTTSAFEQFAKAKELDEQNTYGASYAEMAQTMYDALYTTGQVGSAQFWAAVEATVPDDIYKHLMPGTEQIKAIYDYFNKNIMPTMTFDEDSFSIDYTDIEAFIKKAQKVGVFSGTDVTSFGLSSDFIYGLAEGENALEAFAKRMGMTTTQVYAILSEMDKYTTDGAGLSMLMQLDTSTSGQITYITSELEKLYAQRRALMQQGASDTTLQANMAQIYEYESQLAGLQKQATDTVKDYIVVQNALVDTSKTVREALPYEIWKTELQLTGDETVQEALQQINDYVLTLQEPTVMELQIARDSIDAELDEIMQRFSERELKANVVVNEDGLYEANDGNLTIDAEIVDRYVELKNAQLLIDNALASNLSTQEQLLTNIDKNVATIAGADPASNKDNNKTVSESSTDKAANVPNEIRSDEKPAVDQEAALLTLDTSKALGIFAKAVASELAAEERAGQAGSTKAMTLSAISNEALQLQRKLLDGEIFAEDAIARLSELKTDAAYWDVEIPATITIEPEELEASAEAAADGLTITPDVDLSNRPLVPFNTDNFSAWVDYYNDIVSNANEYSAEFVAHAQEELAAIERGDGTATVYSHTYYKSDFRDLTEGESDAAVVVTPILPDGTVLSPEELQEYAEQLLNGKEIDPNITLGFFEGENFKAEADEFAQSLHSSQAAMYGLSDASADAASEVEALYGVYASPKEALAALELLEKTHQLTPEEALAFGWSLAEGEILTVGDAIKRLRDEIDATRKTSVYNPEQFQETVTMVKTLSELQEEVSDYDEILVQTEEIISDNIEVTQEYKDSLKELGITEEELNECFDDSNPLLVTNAKRLNELVKGAKSNVATNIKLAKSQAQLEYYELYKEMAKLTDGTEEIDGATLEYIQSLYGQMGAVQKTIAQFSMLEAQLLGAANAYAQLEAAQAADSANDYGSKAEEFVSIFGHALNTGELGTQAAQTAFAGLIPDWVLDKTLTPDEQMQQALDYFLDKDGPLNKLFTIEFDDEGNISSVDMTRENVESFTQGLIDAGEVFHGTWDGFTLDASIRNLDDFAEALGVTKEVAFAYLTELEKYDINWLGGDYETLLDQLMGDDIEYQTQKTIQQMAKLRQEMASILEGGIENDAERDRLVEIEKELKNLDGTMAAHQQKAYSAWQTYSDLEAKLSDTANMGKKVSEVFSSEIIQAVGLTGDETVQEAYDRLMAYQMQLGQPTELVLQLASEQAMAELDVLKAAFEDKGVDIEANVHFNTETGEFEYAGDTAGWSDIDLENLGKYIELSNDLYTINQGLGLGIEAMEGYAQRTADAVESIEQAITGNPEKTKNTGTKEQPSSADENTSQPTDGQVDSSTGGQGQGGGSGSSSGDGNASPINAETATVNADSVTVTSNNASDNANDEQSDNDGANNGGEISASGATVVTDSTVVETGSLQVETDGAQQGEQGKQAKSWPILDWFVTKASAEESPAGGETQGVGMRTLRAPTTDGESPSVSLIGNAFMAAELAVAKATLAETEAALAETQATLASTESALADAQAELSSTGAELATTQGTLTSTQAELSSTGATLAATQATLADTQAKLENTQATLTATEGELATTQATLTTTEAELAKAQSNLSSTEGALASTEAALAATQTELASTETELAEAQGNLGDTEAALAEAEANLASTAAELTGTQGTLATTEAELAQTQGTLATTEAELDDTSAALAETEAALAAKTTEAEATAAKLAETEAALATAGANLAQTEENLKASEAALAEAEALLAEKTTEAEATAATLAELEATLAGTQTELTDTQASLVAAEATLKATQSALDAANESVKTLTGEKAALEATLAEQEGQLTTLGEQLATAESALAASEAHAAALDVEVAQLTAQLLEAEGKLANANVTNEALTQDKLALEASLADAETALEDAEQAIAAAKIDLEALATAKASLEASLADTAAKLEGVSAQLDVTQKELDAITAAKATADETIALLNANKAELETSIAQMTSTIGSLTSELTAAQDGRAAAEQAVGTLTQEKATMEQNIACLTDANAALEAKVAELTAQLNAADAGEQTTQSQSDVGHTTPPIYLPVLIDDEDSGDEQSSFADTLNLAEVLANNGDIEPDHVTYLNGDGQDVEVEAELQIDTTDAEGQVDGLGDQVAEAFTVEEILAREGLSGLPLDRALYTYDGIVSRDFPGPAVGFDTTIFTQVLKDAEYTEDQINALIASIQGYENVVLDNDHMDVLGLNNASQQAGEFENALKTLGVTYERADWFVKHPSTYFDGVEAFNIHVPSLAKSLSEQGWTPEEIRAYFDQLSNNTFTNFDVVFEGANELDEVLVDLEGASITDKTFDTTANGASEALQSMKDIDDYTIDDKKYTVTTTYARKYTTIGDTGTVHTSDGGGGRYTMANGTAHAQGTAHKGGSWGAEKTETALVGELGPELV